MNSKATPHHTLAQQVAEKFAAHPAVETVALSGSLRSELVDASSDIDLYVYTRAEVPLAVREAIVQQTGGASRADLGMPFWGPGDEWFHAPTGIEVDIIYFDTRWMAEQVERVMVAHQPSMGYTTCLPYTVIQSVVYHDPDNWFADLQRLCDVPYPEPLRDNIINHNHPVLRTVIPSYTFQLEKAVKRADLVSVNHRLAELLSSYFDILFAYNRQFHPGEKRLVEKTAATCPALPENFETDFNAVFESFHTKVLPTHIHTLLDHLDTLLAR